MTVAQCPFQTNIILLLSSLLIFDIPIKKDDPFHIF